MQSLQQMLQKPLHIRCNIISRWVEECTTKDLEYLLPEIVENIFGISNRAGWNILNIEYTLNPMEYDLLVKFLHPNGPMFRLCYKLLSDPYIKYKFPLSLLPCSIRQSIMDGSALSFYTERLEVDSRTRLPLHLVLNPFELYMFHFMQHVVNPHIKSPALQEQSVYSSLYLRLAEEYLAVFLPCDGSCVLPELPNHFISQSAHRPVPHKPVRTSTVFRQDVLMKLLKQSPAMTTLQTSHVGIWRSELIVQLAIDFWLSTDSPRDYENMFFGSNPQASLNIFSRQSLFNSTPALWSQEQLPSSEHLHTVRLLVKHFHYFTNSLVEDSTAMDQLKKVIIPSSQRRLYHFIRQTMQHWPLDSSFKQIMEIWLSYIQPWRYTDYRNRYDRPRGEPQPLDHRWRPFIAENLLVYSVIFHRLLDRFKMLDLASPRNAYMLFRLTKVFSQQNLADLLKQEETSLQRDGYYSKTVQAHVLDLEGPSFQYEPIFSPNTNIEGFIRLVREAELQAVCRLDEELRKEEALSVWQRLMSWGGVEASQAVNQRRNVPIFLTASIKNLINIFEVADDSIDNIPSSSLSTPVSSRSPAINQMQLTDIWRNLKELKYEGDPDLQTIRSFENTFLVRFLYHLCAWINFNYGSQLEGLYMRRDVVGGVARQLLRGPLVIYHYDKRVPGMSPRVSSQLPPRLSLRPLANYYLLGYGVLLHLLLKIILGLSLPSLTLLALLLWLLVLLLRWMLGYSPRVPVVRVHDVSDLRPDF